MLHIVFPVSLESSHWGGVHGLVSRMFGLVAQKFLNIEWFFHWKCWRNWNGPLVLLERSWWAGLNGIYLVRFGFRMWEMLIFKWFLPLYSNKLKKTRFWKEESIERLITLRMSTIQFKKDLWCAFEAVRKDLDDSDLMEIMLWDLDLGCGKSENFSDFCHWKFK